MPKAIGLVLGDEPLVERALVDRVEREPAVNIGRVVIGGTAERHIGHHDAVLDRMSHRVPHYRTFLRAAALSGANVINDPFALSDDKFFAQSVAARLGLDVPRCVLLPQKGYGPGVDPATSLGNLQFPLLWDELAHQVGFPARLRSARTTVAFDEPVQDGGALLATYDRTWDSPTMLQAEVTGVVTRLRCYCVGGRWAVAVDRDDGGRVQDEVLLAPALRVSRALGLSLNAVDIDVTDRGAWVVDALDAYPRLAPHVLGAEPFDELMDHLAAHLIELTRSPGTANEAAERFLS